MDLRVKLGRLEFRNPVILASGILGLSGSQLRRVCEYGFGGLTTKSYTIEARRGYDTPILAYVKCGLLNAVGLENPGYRELARVRDSLKDVGIPIIVSIAGSKVDEFTTIASYVDELGFDAIELNLSCPHVEGMGLELGDDPNYVYKIVSGVSSIVSIPVYVKIGLHRDLMATVGKSLDGGAEGITAINTIRALAIDVYARKPILSNVYGGLSGPAIHPIAVRIVYDIYREYRIPIIGVGGVSSWDDVIEFILAGASAVGVGTVIAYKGLDVVREILDGIKTYMVDEGFKELSGLIGYANK